VFWVISVYFNIRNTLPKSGTFLLGHSVYTPRFPKRSSPLRILTKILYVFLFSPHVPAVSSVLFWSPHWYFAENACNATCRYAVSSAFLFPQHSCFQKPLAHIFPRLQKRPLVLQGKRCFWDFRRVQNNASNTRRTLIFSWEKMWKMSFLNSKQYGLRFLVHVWCKHILICHKFKR